VTTPAETDAPVHVSSLTRRFGAVRAVDGVTFDVRRGEMFGLIGPDGAGKTTTLRMILGLLKPDAGEVRTFGLDPVRERRRLSSRVGYLSQRFSLYGDLTVDENVAFFAEIHDVREYAARRDALLEMVRMTPFRDRLADRLSGGMKQKLALVCTLVHTPELLVLDEPTTGVDPVTRRELWRLLAELVGDGLTLLVATPYLDEAERCTRVVLMHRGEVLADGRPADIPSRMPGTVVKVTARDRNAAFATLDTASGIADVAVFGTSLHARVDAAGGDAEERVRRLLDASNVNADLRVIRPSLEDAFLYLTTHDTAPTEAT